MWELDHEEGQAPKSWFFQTGKVLEKTLESPFDCKESKPVNPKRNQPWIFTRRTAAEAPILWPPDANSQFIGKDPGAWKDWRRSQQQRMRCITNSMNMNLSKLRRKWRTEEPDMLQSIGSQRVRTQLSDWTTKNNWVPSTTLLHSPASSMAAPYLFLMPHKSTCSQNFYAKSQELIIQKPRDKLYLDIPLDLSNSKNTKRNISSLVNQSSSSVFSTGKWTTSSQTHKLKIWEPFCSFFLNLFIHSR